MEKKIICVDFDGVIFDDGKITSKGAYLIDGASKYLLEISKLFDIYIVTARPAKEATVEHTRGVVRGLYKMFKINIKGIYFTNGGEKNQVFDKLNAVTIIDDNFAYVQNCNHAILFHQKPKSIIRKDSSKTVIICKTWQEIFEEVKKLL